MSLNVDRNNAIIEIKDNGIGIQKSVIENVFDASYQMDLSVEREHVESGLSLPVCKKIIEQHDGKIWVDSPGTDMGTTMHVLLPLYVDQGLRKIN